MKPKNPYAKEYCNWCDRPFKFCNDNLCDNLRGYIKEGAWDEGYNTCSCQPISEQDGWQTCEPSETEGYFLLDMGDHEYRIANGYYMLDTPDRESAFMNASIKEFPYTLFKYVQRWKRI